MAEPADVLQANAARLLEQLAGAPEDPEPLRKALAAMEQAFEGIDGRR